MNEAEPLQPYTRKEYDEFVEEHGHTPTQDPTYKRSAGDPTERPSVDQLKEEASQQRSLEAEAREKAVDNSEEVA